jgi:hypothetical protein
MNHDRNSLSIAEKNGAKSVCFKYKFLYMRYLNNGLKKSHPIRVSLPHFGVIHTRNNYRIATMRRPEYAHCSFLKVSC